MPLTLVKVFPGRFSLHNANGSNKPVHVKYSLNIAALVTFKLEFVEFVFVCVSARCLPKVTTCNLQCPLRLADVNIRNLV